MKFTNGSYGDVVNATDKVFTYLVSGVYAQLKEHKRGTNGLFSDGSHAKAIQFGKGDYNQLNANFHDEYKDSYKNDCENGYKKGHKEDYENNGFDQDKQELHITKADEQVYGENKQNPDEE